MCKKRTTAKFADFPIFSIIYHKNFIIISGGGGGKQFGIENRLMVFEQNAQLSKTLYEKDTKQDLIENLVSNKNTDLLACSSGNDCLVFEIKTNGNLIDIWRKKLDTEELRACIFTNSGDKLIVGRFDGTIQIWSVQKKNDKYEIENKQPEIKHHIKAINHLGLSFDDKLLISASDDNTCRITNLETGDMIKKLSFNDGTKPSNLRFNFCYFSKNGKSVFSIQNHIDNGPSYLTEWDVESNFEPLETFKLHSGAITTSCMSDDGLFLGIGTVDGDTKVIDCRYGEVYCEARPHELITKAVCFSPDSRYLASASPDYSYNFLQNVKSESN